LHKQTTITVFEHQILRTDKGEVRLTVDQLKALQSYYGNGVHYFSLTYNGVQFNEFVGVLQVGNTLIEVLPKADKYTDDKDTWRSMLIGMLSTVSGFEIRSTSTAKLKVKPNTILDLYFELFIKEVEYLLHSGLIKKYRKKEENNPALKGNIIFSKHIQKNITHQEQFYTHFTAYDVVHPLHQILYKTISLLKQINTNPSLYSRIGALLLNFPEMTDIKVSEASFNKIIFNRKSLAYKRAIEIAKMILLQYHPDINKGKNDVLALMFDMNKLWEQFVYVSLKKYEPTSYSITTQTSKNFWKPINGRKTTMRPDIVIYKGNKEYLVLDTKWKNLNGYNPSPDDLRQLYVYHHYYNAKKVALVYPGNFENRNGLYFEPNDSLSDKVCSILTLEVNKDIKAWQVEIFKKIETWTNEVINIRQKKSK
jgi:5-methylcytosine-specific restriction enzyme subunit McrC